MKTGLVTARAATSDAAAAAKLALLRYSVMGRDIGPTDPRPEGRGLADEPTKVVLRARLDGVQAEEEAECFLLPVGREGAGTVAVLGFELGTDLLRFARRPGTDATLAWTDHDGDGLADDLLVSIGARSVALVDLAWDGAAPEALPTVEDLFLI